MINYLYFLIDKRKVVYIGRTKNIGTRIEQHKLDKTFSQVRVMECDSNLIGYYENRWIRLFNPKYNINGKYRVVKTIGISELNVTGLKTVQNYAHYIKRNRSRVYQMIKEGKLDTIIIDGVTFVKTH